MNEAHWHLLTNHFPIIGTIFSTLFLTYGVLFKNQTIRNAGLVLFILTALLGIPAFLTGEGAEDILESIGQKNEFFIHKHEEQAENAFWFSVSIAILSFGTLLNLNRQKKYIPFLISVILLSGIINSVLMMGVGNSGGEIRHTEIRGNIRI